MLKTIHSNMYVIGMKLTNQFTRCLLMQN